MNFGDTKLGETKSDVKKSDVKKFGGKNLMKKNSVGTIWWGKIGYNKCGDQSVFAGWDVGDWDEESLLKMIWKKMIRKIYDSAEDDLEDYWDDVNWKEMNHMTIFVKFVKCSRSIQLNSVPNIFNQNKWSQHT